MHVSRKASFAAGAVAALVIGSGTAFAANGGSFLLGKANSAGKVSTLTNAKGTALSLASKKGTAAFKVSNKVLIAKLNADLLDGQSAASFASAKGGTSMVTTEGSLFDSDGDGATDSVAAIAQCPKGTVLTGGGYVSKAAFPTLNAPGGARAWYVAVPDGSVNPTTVKAYAVCLNLAGAAVGTPTARTAAGRTSLLREVAAR